MAVTLSLGGVVFQDFEIPEEMPFGGEQRLNIKKLPGGARIIDAMGPDDADKPWQGRFRGSTAVERALLLDQMRVSGQVFTLSWSVFRYQVVIQSFKANFKQAYEIPYSITCVVLVDELQVLAQAALSFIDAMAGDVLNAVGLGGLLSSAQINSAVTTLGAAFTNFQAGVPTATNLLAGASAIAEGPLFASLSGAISGAQVATQSDTTAMEAALNSAPGSTIGGVVAGGAPTSMASTLVSQASSYLQLDRLYQLSSTLGRLATNTTNAQANGSTVLH